MYKVVTKKNESYTYKGDLTSRVVVIDTLVFSTRKSAISYIEKKLNTRGFKDISREYHKGDKESICIAHTGNSWFNEGTGEVEQEVYNFILTKEKVRK